METISHAAGAVKARIWGEGANTGHQTESHQNESQTEVHKSMIDDHITETKFTGRTETDPDAESSSYKLGKGPSDYKPEGPRSLGGYPQGNSNEPNTGFGGSSGAQPSVSADPSSGQQASVTHQGSGRPREEPEDALTYNKESPVPEIGTARTSDQPEDASTYNKESRISETEKDRPSYQPEDASTYNKESRISETEKDRPSYQPEDTSTYSKESSIPETETDRPSYQSEDTSTHSKESRVSETGSGESAGSTGGGVRPSMGGMKLPESENKSQSEGTGTLYEKSTGFQCDGGDFDAARPGAAREADRLMDEKGIARIEEPQGTDDGEQKEKKWYGVDHSGFGGHGSHRNKRSSVSKSSDDGHNDPDYDHHATADDNTLRTEKKKKGISQKIKEKLHHHSSDKNNE